MRKLFQGKLKNKKHILVAFIVLAVAVGWLLIGTGGKVIIAGKDNHISPNQQATHAPGTLKKIEKVRIVETPLQYYHPILRLTGQTKAKRHIVLKSQIKGWVESIKIREGDIVKKDDILLTIAPDERLALLEEAKANLAQAEIEYNAAKKLSQKGFEGKVRVARLRAQLESAKANLARHAKNVENLTINSPFDGIITAQHVEVGDVLSEGGRVAEMIDTNPLTLSVDVSEKNRGRIALNTKVVAYLLGGEEVEGHISYIASIADEGTRTFEVEVNIPNENFMRPAGTTVSIDIPLKPVQARKIRSSDLGLDDAGTLGIKIIDGGKIVKFLPAVIVGDEGDYIWVSDGYKQNVQLISTGHPFVSDGAEVIAVKTDSETGTATITNRQ